MVKRAVVVLGAALVVGCQDRGASNNGNGGGGPTTAPAPMVMKPAAAPAVAAAPAYFEVPGPDGKTYVLGSGDSVRDYFASKRLPPMTTETETVKGQPVSVEAAYAERLVKEYEKTHK